jgi:hypothetical protein
MVRTRRRALHGRVAKAMRDQAPTEAETQPQLLATHFTEAGEIESAITWWLAAGARSLKQSAMTEGLDQLERARDLLETQPDTEWRRQTEMTLLIYKAKAHVATSGHASDTVGENFRRARALCDSLPGAPQLLTVTFGEWSHYVTRGPLLNAARLAREIRALAEQTGDPLHIMCGFYASGMTDTVMGHFTTARDFLEKGLKACAQLSPADFTASVGDPSAIMAAYLSLIAMCQGRMAESRHYTTLSLKAAYETKLTYSIALALSMRATIRVFGGVPDEGDADLDALRDFAGAHGMVFFESIEICFRGWETARRGDHAAGLHMLEEGFAKYLKTQSGVWLWTFLRMKAEMRLNRRLPGWIRSSKCQSCCVHGASCWQHSGRPRRRAPPSHAQKPVRTGLAPRCLPPRQAKRAGGCWV